MIRDIPAVWQALLGSLFTWGLTALGAGGVFVLRKNSHKVLDGSLGFAAGVMTAASFWSLLAPAIEMTEESHGVWAFVPVSIGFLAGALFVYLADIAIPYISGDSSHTGDLVDILEGDQDQSSSKPNVNSKDDDGPRMRKKMKAGNTEASVKVDETPSVGNSLSWRRIFLLIVAITVHNIPEGLAVGVGFGAIGSSPKATYERATALAFGIGIQNFPEGLAVSLPLAGFGYSKFQSFWYGQLSGMVEPVAALLGAIGVQMMQSVLPYALAFAAGAMIYVVVDDIIPEAQAHGNSKLASAMSIVGFVVMMSLDVALG